MDELCARLPEVADYVAGVRFRVLDGFEIVTPTIGERPQALVGRLRAALEVYAGCFPRRPHARLLRLVKGTADALSEARDLDVQIDHLAVYRARVPHAHRAGVDSLIGTLRERRAAANQHLEPALARLDADGFATQVDALVGDR